MYMYIYMYIGMYNYMHPSHPSIHTRWEGINNLTEHYREVVIHGLPANSNLIWLQKKFYAYKT